MYFVCYVIFVICDKQHARVRHHAGGLCFSGERWHSASLAQRRAAAVASRICSSQYVCVRQHDRIRQHERIQFIWNDETNGMGNEYIYLKISIYTYIYLNI